MKFKLVVLTTFVFAMLMLPKHASADGETFTIEYNQNVQLQYGAYAEVEVALKAVKPGDQAELDKKRIYWEILQDTLPEGLELEESEASHLLIFGTPKFTDKWCFVMRAIAWDNGENATANVCLKSKDHGTIPHPRFKTARDLKYAMVRESYSNKIEVEAGTGSLWILENISMPEGLKATLIKKNIELKGKLSEAGVKTVTLRILNDKGYKTAKQFVLEVFENQYEEPLQCPNGYAWDSYYQDCVPTYDAAITCYPGYYWSEYHQECLEFDRPTDIVRPIHRPRPPRPDYDPNRPIHRPPLPAPLPPQDRPDNPDRPIHTPPPPSYDPPSHGPDIPPQDRPDNPDRPIHNPPPPSYDPPSYDPPSYDPGPDIPPQDRPSEPDRPIHTPSPPSYDPPSYDPPSYDPPSYNPPSYDPPSHGPDIPPQNRPDNDDNVHRPPRPRP